MKIQLLSAATATNSPPTAGSTDVGFGLAGIDNPQAGVSHFVPVDGQCAIVVKSTAGSATMTVTLKFWVYAVAVAEWMPLGTHSGDSTKGVLNQGNAIGEVAANSLLHTELVNGLQHYDRVYLEITAIGGTDTAVDAYLVGR